MSAAGLDGAAAEGRGSAARRAGSGDTAAGRGASCMASAPIRRLRPPVESPVWGWLGGAAGALGTGLLGALLALPFLAVGVVLLPCYLLTQRLLLALHLLWHRQSVCERVSGTEACWLRGPGGSAGPGRGPAGRSLLHAVLVLECPGPSGSGMDVARLRDLVATRLLPLYPRLTARPLAMPLTAGGGLCWVQDADFSVSRHVFAADCGGDGLQVYISRLIDKGLPEDRPPWEMRLLASCGARKSEVVVVVRVHHALADGDALVRVLCSALADNPIAQPKQARRGGRGLLRFGLALVRALAVGPLSLLGWLVLRARDDNLLLAGRGPRAPGETGSSSVAWSAGSAGIALSKVRRIQQVSRCSLNCVLLAAVGGALRVLLQGCGVRQPPDLQVAIPISMHRHKTRTSRAAPGGNGYSHLNGGQDGEGQHSRHHHHHHHHHHQHHHHFERADSHAHSQMANNHGKNGGSTTVNHNNNQDAGIDEMSNKTTPVVVGLPVSVEGAVPRLWATRRCLQCLRSAADPEVVYMASLGGALGGSWSARLLAALTDKASIQFATLSGPPSVVLVGGAVLKAVYPLQPPPGHLGIAVTVFVYADQVFVTVSSDEALGPAGTLLLHHFNVQIELLWRLLRHRRAPGEARPPPAVRRADVQASPVGELTTRLCYVQGELERLAHEDYLETDADGHGTARLSSLKAEFTSLMHEVRKRQARARRMQDKQLGRRSRRAEARGCRRKRAVSFSLPQRPSLSFGGLLRPGGSDAVLDDRASPSPSTPRPQANPAPASVSIGIPGEGDALCEAGEDPGHGWVRASFERAARQSLACLDPQLAEYYRGVQLEAPGGAYPCRCNSSGSASPTDTATDNSQDEESGDAVHRPRPAGRRRASSPEQDYDAIADAYYPAELKNRTKFSLLEDSTTDLAAVAPAPQGAAEAPRRPSCLKKVPRRESPPSDQSSPSLSTSVLHQLRSYYDESYLTFRESYPEHDAYAYRSGELTSPEELDDELPPPRERTAAFSVPARSPPKLSPRQTFLEPPRAAASFTCRDAEQMRYADADDSDSTATPSVTPLNDRVALALVHSPPRDPPVLAVKSSTPADPHQAGNSSSSTSPRPKFLTQSSSSSGHSHSASPRSPLITRAGSGGSRHRQSSADNGYFEESVVSLSTSHDGLSALSGLSTADSVINLTSSSVSASVSPHASPRGVSPGLLVAPACAGSASDSEEAANLVDAMASLVRPNSLIIKRAYRI